MVTPSKCLIARSSGVIPGFKHKRDCSVNTFVFEGVKIIRGVDSIASRLIKARTDKDLSQQALANLSGVSQSTIGNIEAGIRKARGSLPQIAEALGVRLKWLRDGELPQREETAWPFAMVDRDRYENLGEPYSGYVQGRLQQAIEEAEKKKEADALARARIPSPSPLAKSRRKG